MIRNLDRSRFEVHVACFDHEGPLLDQLPLDIGNVLAFPLEGFARLSTIRQAIRFIWWLRKTNIQIVQTFDLYTNIFGIPLVRVAGVPIAVGSRRDHSVTRSPWQVWAERWSLRLANRVVVNAEAIRERLTHDGVLEPDRIVVIKNGIDLDRFSVLGQDSKNVDQTDSKTVVFGVVANLRPEKNHLIFLQAARIVASSCPEARFLLVGDGPMRQKIQNLIRDLDLGQKIDLMGAVKDVPRVLQGIDVVVSPSDTEGLPNAVLEAMAASKAVVATNAGGTRELVEEGVTGHLVPVGDAEQLARRMIELCKRPLVRLNMGVSARCRVEKYYSADLVTKRFEFLYDEIASDSGI